MAFNPTDFANEVLKDINIDEAKKQALLEVISNPTIAKRLEESTLRQSDYSKKLDEQKALLKKTQDYWDGLVTWKTDKEKEFDARDKEIKKKLIDEGVDLGGGTEKSKTVTSQELQELAQQSVAYQNTVMKLAMQHFKEYGEILDTDKLLEIAGRDRINVVQAYSIYETPKREEIRKAEFDKAIAKAREEGKEEAVKNFSLPTSEQPQNLSGNPYALDNLNKTKSDQYGPMAAVKAYSENMRRGKRAGSDGF